MKRQPQANFDRPTSNSPNAPVSLALILTCVLTIVSGCATRKTPAPSPVAESLPRPKQILVYNFAASANEVPNDAFILRQYLVDTTATQTADESAAGHDLGAKIAADIAAHLQASGLPAERVALGTQPPAEINDIVIRGYLVSVTEGNAAKRITIGFGRGASELKAAAEVFQVTPHGLRKLESSTSRSGGSSSSGPGVGAAGFAAAGNPEAFIFSSDTRVDKELSGSTTIHARARTAAQEIAKVLESRAREQGWIK